MDYKTVVLEENCDYESMIKKVFSQIKTDLERLECKKKDIVILIASYEINMHTSDEIKKEFYDALIKMYELDSKIEKYYLVMKNIHNFTIVDETNRQAVFSFKGDTEKTILKYKVVSF